MQECTNDNASRGWKDWKKWTMKQMPCGYKRLNADAAGQVMGELELIY